MTKIGLMPIVEVSVPAAGIPDALKYELPDSLWADDLVGRRVKVTLRNRPVAGVITGAFKISPNPPFLKGGKLKPIECLLDEKPVITPEQIKLARFVANYYMAPLGEVLRLCLPPNTPRTLKKDKLPKRRKKKKEAEVEQKAEPVELNDEQKEALGKITHVVMPAEAGIQNKAGVTGLDASLRWHDKTAFLLEGITGSGKTEVYIHAAQWARAQNKSVLVVVPEIALTLQLCDRFASQLGEAPLMLHSGLRNTQRYDVFETLLKGEPKILLGARSALFAPLSNLGLIVIDEEHDPSFKQDDTPRYHARDVALWRAKQEGAKIILGSATPSLESRLNAKQGKLTHLKLTKRASSNSVLPQIELIDLRSRKQHEPTQKVDRSQSEGQNLCILSNPLRLSIQEALNSREQVLLFLNRRGYASLTVCDACGSQVHCPNCSVSLTYHQTQNRYHCHQCDYFVSISMICPSCHEGPILRLGVGTERIEKEVELFFPGVKTARLDRDSASSPRKMNQILEEVRSGDAQILIGTQMTAKGHDFPNLSLVGVVLADVGLSMPDFRASERTFQLLTQVAGRAGRRERPGRVLIQTFNPQHSVFKHVTEHQISEFAELDASQRQEAKQPPFVRAALLRLESLSQPATVEAASTIRMHLEKAIAASNLSTQASLLGPAPAPIEKLRNKWRWQLYLRTANYKQRAELLQDISKLKLKNARLVVDIDPVQML